MAGTAYNTVCVQGNPNREEYLSAVALEVGMIVQENSSNELALSAVASATYEGGEAIVAEAPERGKGILNSSDAPNTYAVGEQVPVIFPRRGDKVLLMVTDGQVIANGDLLEIAATGKAIGHAGAELPYARALEALSPSGDDGLILARKL